MQVIPGDQGEGVRLIVNEIPYTGPEQAGQEITALEQGPNGNQIARFASVVPGSQSFVLADKLAFCHFSYLERLPEAPFQVWTSGWLQSLRFPLAIRIEMTPLDPAPSELRISTVTVPLNVNRIPFTLYADVDPQPQR
jgi:hypothetical protein